MAASPKNPGLVARLRLIVLGGVFAGLAVALWPAGVDGASGPASDAGGLRVIDGDTFDLGGQRIRIAGIDAPELNGRCAREIELAHRARSRVRALLAAGPFELVPVGDRDVDRYGRKLRDVVRAGRSIGDTLVAEGLAREWRGFRRPWCSV